MDRTQSRCETAAAQGEQHPARSRQGSEHSGETTDGGSDIERNGEARRRIAQSEIIERRLGLAQRFDAVRTEPDHFAVSDKGEKQSRGNDGEEQGDGDVPPWIVCLLAESCGPLETAERQDAENHPET